MGSKTVTVRLEALVAQYQASMAKATASTRVFGEEAIKTAQKNHQSLQTLGIAGVAFGGALAFGLKTAADAAIEFESSFAGVRKTVDGTELEFQAISDGLREMATRIPVNVNELARIAESAGQLGVQKDSILAFTETVAKMGLTTTLSTEDAANGLARLMNIMQTAPDRVGNLASTIVALGNAGASTEGEILDFGLRIAGAGHIAGLTEANILAIGNAMASAGVEAEAGGTSVQKVLLSILDAVNTGGDKLEAFSSTAGMSADEFAAAWRDDPAQAFLAFIEGLGAAGQRGTEILRQLGLTDERVRRSFLSLAGAGDLLRRSLDDATTATEENNALNEEAAKRAETTASKIQLAKNEVNDAAIAFGEVLLPAIAAVASVLGDIIGAIGGLNGPLKTIVVVAVAAAATMAILTGAAVLLVDRLRLTRLAMMEVTGQASIMKGALVLAGRAAISPWTLAITAATVGIGLLVSAHERAKQRVESLTEAIKADSGALAQHTRAFIVDRLQTEGAGDAAEAFGISLTTLTDAALGNKEAMAEVDAALGNVERGTQRTMPAFNRVRDSLNGIASDLPKAKEEAQQEAAAMGESADKTDEAATTADRYKAALSDLNPEMAETGDLASALKDAFDALAGSQLDVEEAAIKWRASVAKLRETLSHGTKTLDIFTEAGRENRSQILESIHAAIDHGAAVANESGSIDKGVKVTIEHIRALMDEAEAAGFAKEDIEKYIEQLNLTPKMVRTLIEANVLPAKNAVDAFIRDYSGKVVNITVREKIERHGGHGVHHAGGVAGESGAHRYHGGGVAGWPDMRGNEVPAILERGELVLSNQLLRSMRMASVSSSGVGAAGAETPPIIYATIPVYLGDERIAEYFVNALRGEILREAT